MAKLRKAYRSKTRSSPTHSFRFLINKKKVSVKTKVKGATAIVPIELTVDDVQRAIDNFGFGDGHNCAGAVCVDRHGPAFENHHRYTGYVDWWDYRAFLSSRNNKLNMPTHCVAYHHNHPEISKLFDSKAGLKRLLEVIERDGPITIILKPLPKYDPTRRYRKNPSGPSGEKRRIGHNLRLQRVIVGHGMGT
jgi:hypothetical protein